MKPFGACPVTQKETLQIFYLALSLFIVKFNYSIFLLSSCFSLNTSVRIQNLHNQLEEIDDK